MQQEVGPLHVLSCLFFFVPILNIIIFIIYLLVRKHENSK